MTAAKHSDISFSSISASVARTLRIEGAAITAFSHALPEDMEDTVRLIMEAKGRVVLSGMGKSGHIARKIAATLASTGTPAFFVHPAEASHGDLGMVAMGDVVIAISNSGETSELSDLLSHCLFLGIPIIGISRQADSTLMRAARFRLLLPDVEEACALGLAPTTSTTLTLALGDALAVAIMEQRGFRSDQFRSFHPGGRLGARLATVRQLMYSGDQVPLVSPETPMSETILRMTEHGFGITGVVDRSEKLVGVISDGDLRRHMNGLLSHSAGEIATQTPVTVASDTVAVEAVGLMNMRKVNAVFVVDTENRPIGILRLHDCLRAGAV
ncbi:KpsF/GutQ family sugar-phosphate isomerase [Ensifer soli]|uniref:KpsF/GutQ family sugar-phosphate isomerase n=1 Tax=Ciceribacter sp. sgz301302 TaxID=3342379 RepID=UPI0035B9FA9E